MQRVTHNRNGTDRAHVELGDLLSIFEQDLPAFRGIACPYKR
jgi:hypothetical protein